MTEKITDILSPSLELLGYRIVRVALGGKVRKTLQIMIERIDDQPITVDDCATASYHISPLLDVENLIQDAYTLEVSSAGLNRPLVKKEDFLKYVGSCVMVKTHHLIQERKRFKARLAHADDENIVLEMDFGSVLIPYSDILSACLDIEDHLFSKK